MNNYAIKVENLKIDYETISERKNVLTIDELVIKKGTAFGLIGESGSGKSVFALSLLQLLSCPPGKYVDGKIFVDGVNVLELDDSKMEEFIRGKKISMIFQDPMSFLNPVFTIEQQIIPIIVRNQIVNKETAMDIAMEMLRQVKLPDPEQIMKKYPHELSGGQRQRIIIAFSLCCNSNIIIADEPTRNLDVTIQAGILRTLKKLQEDNAITLLFISNNPSLINIMCEEAAILFQGRIIEKGSIKRIKENPVHPYTKSLFNIANEKIECTNNNLGVWTEVEKNHWVLL